MALESLNLNPTEEEVENTLTVLKDYTEKHIINNILKDIENGNDKELIEFLNDFEKSKDVDYGKTRIIHKEGYKHDGRQNFQLKNSADIILTKIENYVGNNAEYTKKIKSIKPFINDVEVKEKFNKYTKDKIASLIFKYFEHKTDKMLEDLKEIQGDKEKFEALYKEHKKLFLAISNVC